MVRSPHLPDAAPKAAGAFLTGKQVGSDIGLPCHPLLAGGTQFPEPKRHAPRAFPSPSKVRDLPKLGADHQRVRWSVAEASRSRVMWQSFDRTVAVVHDDPWETESHDYRTCRHCSHNLHLQVRHASLQTESSSLELLTSRRWLLLAVLNSIMCCSNDLFAALCLLVN
jgi:hypothetical protein